jgi:hypothetical protein
MCTWFVGPGHPAADRRTVKVLGNGARASFSYDNAARLTRLVNIKSSGVTISSFNYKYDNATNRTGVLEASGDRVTWTYDATYQLTHEKRSGVNSYDVTYTYDPLGNRLVKLDSGSPTTSVYDAANRITYGQDSTGRTTFTFDATGNQTQQKTPTLQITTSVWDFENMNTATILPTLSRVTLTYNGDQQRVEKDTASLTRKYVFDGQNILLETDGTNLTQAVYTLEPLDYGNLLSQRQNQSGTWVPINYSFDGLGSTDSLTDGSQVMREVPPNTWRLFGNSGQNVIHEAAIS